MVWGNQTSGVRPDDSPKVSTSGHSVVAEFGILMVCTGNVCRSPMAEQLMISDLRKALESAFGPQRAAALAAQVVVTSAGIAAHEGDPMTPESIAESERLGGGGRAHLAHRISEKDIREADLVLAMTQDHRAAIAKLDPTAARRAFTLNEFARLLRAPSTLDDLAPAEGDDLAATLRHLVPAVAASRGYLPPASPKELDVVDPYGRGSRVYTQVATLISEGTTTLAGSFVKAMRET